MESTALARVEAAELERPGDGAMLGVFLANKRSERTREAYGRDLKAFARFLREPSTDPGAIARAMLRASIVNVVAWRDSLESQAPASIARRLASLRMFYRFAIAAGMTSTNPAEAVEAPRVEAERQNRPSLEAADARSLLDAPDLSTMKGKRDRAILGLLASSGLRRAEVAGLSLGNVRLEPAGIAVTVEGKGGKVRTVDLDKETAEVLVAYLQAEGRDLGVDPGAPLFRPTANPRGGGDCSGKLTLRAVNALVASYATRAGVVEATPHALRRTFATVALDRGASIETLRRTLGHSDPRTTARYDRRRTSTLTVTY